MARLATIQRSIRARCIAVSSVYSKVTSNLLLLLTGVGPQDRNAALYIRADRLDQLLDGRDRFLLQYQPALFGNLLAQESLLHDGLRMQLEFGLRRQTLLPGSGSTVEGAFLHQYLTQRFRLLAVLQELQKIVLLLLLLHTMVLDGHHLEQALERLSIVG